MADLKRSTKLFMPSLQIALQPPAGQQNYRLLKRIDQPIELAYCWAYACRKLNDVARISIAPIVEDGLKRIAELYRIETDICGQSPQVRLAARQEQSAPKIVAFETWLREYRARVSGKSSLGEALQYIAKYWDSLILFLSDGRIELCNNTPFSKCKHSLASNDRVHHSPNCPEQKNALFAEHDVGAQDWGIMASLIETCELNDIEPNACLTATLTDIINGHMQSDIEQLLPWNYTSNV